MDSLFWKSSFCLGDEEIDREHRKFLDLLNDCCLAARGQIHGKIDPILVHKLKAYAAMHFSYEEDLMRTMGYPDLERHQLQHRYFEEQIHELADVVAKHGERRIESIAAFLRDWFLRHILEQDKEYIPCIKQGVIRKAVPGAGWQPGTDNEYEG